jgi:hypothetical protein
MNEEVQIEEQATGQPNADADFTAESQETKTFTQEDLDKIVKDRLDRERKRVQKQYEGVDVDKYREMMEAEEQTRLEQQKARGEFEKVLQETVAKKDANIQQLQNELHSIKVDGNLLNAASSQGAINPQQVVSLLKSNIRLGADGEVEVLDNDGSVRFTEAGTAMSVNDLVDEFMSQNPHFKSAGPSGSGSRSAVADSVGSQPGKVDTSKLNMNDPKDREVYRQYMKSKGIRI